MEDYAGISKQAKKFEDDTTISDEVELDGHEIILKEAPVEKTKSITGIDRDVPVPGIPVPGLAILSYPGPGQVTFFYPGPGPGQMLIYDPGPGPG